MWYPRHMLQARVGLFWGGATLAGAFSGLLAPYWDPGAAGLLIGLSSYTTPAHIALATLEANRKAMEQAGNIEDAFISENDILGPRKKAKADYAERIASIEKGREGREKYGSLKGKKKKEAPSSTTNREKARNKPLMMILASGAVRGKKKASLREKQQRLRAHIEKAKKSYH